MSRIDNQRPVDARTAVMTEKQERAYMASFRSMEFCEACGVSDGTIVPAHFNLNAGGTGYRAKGIVAGLCNRPRGCHDIIDRRSGTDADRMWVLERLVQKLLRDRAYSVSQELKEVGYG